IIKFEILVKIFILFLFILPLGILIGDDCKPKSDWNSDFREGSINLYLNFDSFKEPSVEYLQNLYSFLIFHECIKFNRNLIKRLQNATLEDKFICLEGNYFIKKRHNNNLNDVFFWEISIILSLHDYVIPTYAIQNSNLLFIIQPKEDLYVGNL